MEAQHGMKLRQVHSWCNDRNDRVDQVEFPSSLVDGACARHSLGSSEAGMLQWETSMCWRADIEVDGGGSVGADGQVVGGAPVVGVVQLQLKESGGA